ncbi:MAG: hypothetical protein ACFCVK_22485 [Acidimicrobiales bacterium]
MEWFAGNWPVVLVVLAVALILVGMVRRLLKLAFLGVVLAVVGLVIWPLLHT